MGLFSSTAEFYGAYRSHVPHDVATRLTAVAPLGSPRRLLDVGTGTGFVIQALMPFFDQAVGIDIDTDLLAVAQANLDPYVAAGQVTLERSAAESFTMPVESRAHLITVCRAFHWFDRARFLARAADNLIDGGTLAVFADRSIWTANAEWKSATLDVVREFLGDQRRAGKGAFEAPRHDYADDLHNAGYRDIERQSVPVQRVRNSESVIGYLHSTSFASLAVLGDAAEAFDERVRERLAPLVDADGLLHDENEFDILTAMAPS